MSNEVETDEEQGGLDRRNLLKGGFGFAGVALGASVLAACGSDTATAPAETSTGASSDSSDESSDTSSDSSDESTDTTVNLAQDTAPEIEWEMATSWPTALVTIFGGAQRFAEEVGRLTGGKFKINARAAGEIVGGTEVLGTVADGGVDVGHTASYYYTGLHPATQFGTAVPFGLTNRQQNAWLYEGGGLELMREFYAEEFGVIQFPAGNTGVQMGGWFTKEINTADDLNGLKMRIPGIAGKVLTALGGEQVSMAGGEILPAIQQGTIDAAEFVGPTDDLILGLNEFGGDLFYYHPGWWEPGPTLEVQIPISKWESLPPQYQAAVENAAATANVTMMAKYDALNPINLQEVKGFANIREFSPEIMKAFKDQTEITLDEQAADSEWFARILGPWREFRTGVQEWHGLAEASMLRAAEI